MKDLNENTLIEILARVDTDPDQALQMLIDATAKESKYPSSMDEDPEENVQTIPDDPDLSNIRYLRYLRKTLKGRRPDPLVLAAIEALMRKYGYPVLAKVIAKLARKMKFHIQTRDTEIILRKYGKVIVPLMAIIFIDIVNRYHKLSNERSTDNRTTTNY